MYWLLDFDDTLVSGPMTWALHHAIPRLTTEHQLRYSQEQLEAAILTAQRRSNQEFDPLPILHDFFVEMGWPLHLQNNLMEDVQTGYQPELFDDALPFLQRLREAGHQALIVSNNNRAPKALHALKLDALVAAIYTPKMFPDCQPKPQRGLWEVVTSRHQDVMTLGAIMVGDDPWSDGEFAENCGMNCWLLDRLKRYHTLYKQKSYHWCSSLLDIPL